MSVAENAGRLADPADLVDVDASSAPTTTSGRTRPGPAQRVAFGTSGHRGTSTARHVQRGPRRSPSARRSAATAPSRASTARCSSGATRTRCPSRPSHTHRRGALRPRRRRRGRRRRRLHADARDLARDPHPQPRRRRGTRRRDRRHARRTTRPRTAASSTTRRTAGRPTPTSRGWIQRRGQRAARGRARATSSARRGPRLTCAATTTSRLRRRPARTSIDLDAIRDGGLRLGVDPLGGASVAYWQAIAERHGLDLTIVNDEVDPTFRFVPLDRDGKIRMDCSSPYAMARAARAARPLRRRLRQRPRRRPPRDRHAGRRAAEPQPPPRGRASPTCSAARRDWRADAGDRQDARLQRDHRPRGRGPRPARSSRSRSASSGSSTGCSTARSASAARRARAPRSCAATARRGRPTRTA